ncbi:response regulator [Pseudomonas mosselii]|uniref:response regulator n=1 Tax=Pseudomonas mosselii TaxID=78327 RepID=UPI0021DB567E|nr:response regulator [Pseudomonas mosselii]MCU9528488.1 response regulator [Pseudomonas mosselii]MCU9535822.1 response regulator [Pseudomonas mosselii]MCU9543865.1 response regulator [Pseudomonas mosselii]MCU9550450.1 response regulator [Pseudomonas mosselii]
MSDKPLRVMIVDDSRTIRKAGEDYLTSAGCEVVLAEDGFDCLTKIKDFEPDFIFVDVMMPRLDGYAVTEVIRSHAELQKCPVVMLSSKDGVFDKAKGMAAGATDYLSKPFKSEDLIASITKHHPGFSPT